MPGRVFIYVDSCRAIVARHRADRIEFATNWEELERDAEEEVWKAGGAINLSGWYPCSRELARRARWPKETPDGVGAGPRLDTAQGGRGCG